MPDFEVLPLLGGLGALLAVPAGGALLARLIYRGRYVGLGLVDRTGLALSIGLAATTTYLVVLAHAGMFLPNFVGGPGWLLAGALAYRMVLIRRAKENWFRRSRGRLYPWPALAAAMVLLMPLAYLPGVDEPILVGRDQQLYLDMGLKLAREGHFEHTLVPAGAGDGELLDEAFRIMGKERHIVPGTFAKGTRDGRHLVPYLPAGYSGWIAVMAWLGALPLAHATNTFVWSLALWLAFVLARRKLGEPLALVACGTVALLPTTFWTAGVTLSEPLAFALAVSMAMSMVHVRHRLAFVGPFICLTAATLIRIDALVLGFVMTLALAVRSWQPDRELFVRHEARDGSIAVALSVVITLTFYGIWYPFYLHIHATQVRWSIVGVALGAFVAYWGAHLGQQLLGNARVARLGSILVGGSLVIGFAYGAIIRPSMEPFAIIANGTEIDGVRDFREDSLRNLAVYVSWPALMLAVAGAIMALDRARREHVTLSNAFVLLAFVMVSVLFLAYPQVSPDHPFAIRRFVPIVIPGIIFFACYALLKILAKISRRSALIVGPAIALAIVPLLASEQWDGMRLAEGSGTSRHVAELAALLPSGLVVADVDLAALATSLVLRYGCPVIPVSFVESDRAQVIRAWSDTRRSAGGYAPLLHRLGSLPANVEIKGVPRILAFDRVRLMPAWVPPARDVITERMTLQLSQVRVTEPRADRIFGGAPLWGAEEMGFLRPEVAPFGTFRWTDGAATIVVPLRPDDRFDRVKVDLFALERPGRATRVEIGVNGNVVLSEALPGGISTRIVAVPVGSAEREIVLRISSDTATPKSLGIGSSDQQLGVGVIGLRMLRPGELTADSVRGGTEGFAYRLRPLVDGAAVAMEAHERHVELPLQVSNEGTLPWPTLRESGRIEGAVQVGARWYRQGDRSAVLSDQRWTIELGLHPGDRTTIAARFAPEDSAGRRFPPGRYDLKLGLVRETIAWLPEAADDATVVAIEVR